MGASARCTRTCTPGCSPTCASRTHEAELAEQGIEPFELLVSNLYPFERDGRGGRRTGCRGRADRHRRPGDGARRREEPRERRGRDQPDAVTATSSTRSQTGGTTLAAAPRAGAARPSGTRRATTSPSPPGWATCSPPTTRAPDSRAGSAPPGMRVDACCATARTRTSAPPSTAAPARRGHRAGDAAGRQGDVVQQLRGRRRRGARRLRPPRPRRSRSSSTPTRAASRPPTRSPRRTRRAHACDPVSAYGGVIAANRPITHEAAESIAPIFTEVVVAPGFEPEALEMLQAKKNLRLLELPAGFGAGRLEFRQISGGLLIQTGRHAVRAARCSGSSSRASRPMPRPSPTSSSPGARAAR